MNVVKDDVEKLVQKELEAANEKFPLFHSAHEGYGVLLEELQELKNEMHDIKEYKKLIKNDIHKNDNQMLLKHIKIMGFRATLAAIEAIQVVAMCGKFQMSYDSQWDNVE